MNSYIIHILTNLQSDTNDTDRPLVRGGGGELPYMGYLGMCCYEGYGFQAVYSEKGYINPRVWVQNKVSFARKLINWLKTLV